LTKKLYFKYIYPINAITTYLVKKHIYEESPETEWEFIWRVAACSYPAKGCYAASQVLSLLPFIFNF